jgi:hypothetical protein
MKRCSNCLLTDTLPESDFDASGKCSWCRSNYPNYSPKGKHHLDLLLSGIPRRGLGAADCIVGLSGGKDSSYALVELKKTFGLRCEAFTYSHFGLNAFALKNAQDVCAALDVKHHVVSLPGDAHLKSFQRYFKVWLRHNSITSAGLSCAACKHLHLLGTRLAQERGIPIVFWSNCPLEYAPFIAVKLITTKEGLKRGTLVRKTALLFKEMAGNPRLCMSIMRDFPVTVPGCLAMSPDSRYLRLLYPNVKHAFFYEYCAWQPKTILGTLEKDVGWHKPEDYPDDWHSDCAFNVFKEYMFQKMLGVSYTDSFLSSQIRSGIMTRSEGLALLLASKRFYKDLLSKELSHVGLEKYGDRIDYACFDNGGEE